MYEENYLSEFNSETERKLARNNLGVYSKDEVGKIVADIIGKDTQTFITRLELEEKLAGLDFVDSELKGTTNYEIPDKLHKVEFSELSQDTMPIAIKAFLDSTDFEDAIRNAISVGGDSDTIACITGAIAEAFYGIPEDIRIKALSYLPDFLFYVYAEFEKTINTQKITFNKKNLQHYMKLIEYRQNGILDEFLQNEEKIKIYLESVCD